MYMRFFGQISGKITLCIFLVIIADFLFYKENFGWTFGIFGFAILGCTLLRNNKGISDYSLFSKVVIALTFALLLSLFENLSTLSVCMSSLALITVASPDNKKWQTNTIEWFLRIRRFLIMSLFRVLFDIFKDRRIHRAIKDNKTSQMQNWLLPIIFSIIFILLFADANPIVSQYVNLLRLDSILNLISIHRIIFWALFATFCWAIIRHRINVKKGKRSFLPRKTFKILIHYLFSEGAIFRSLIIFNILFVIQNAMDIQYLWAGTEIPQGFSLAQYSHKGAYTLIITAILAAIFAIISLKNNENTTIKRLINIWVGQNIFLVLSSIWRTLLYIDTYSLTYLRVAALIWMAIVALGLLYIILRNIWNKSSLWLININVITLLFILYISCFVNFGYFISQYNVRSSYEVSGHGKRLDIYYLYKVGVSSLPAIKLVKVRMDSKSNKFKQLEQFERNLESKLKNELYNWRSWTYRKYRISEETLK